MTSTPWTNERAIAAWAEVPRAELAAMDPYGDFAKHPCFEDLRTSWREHGSLVVREYLHEYELTVPHGIDLHRPLSDYINHVLALGCRLAEIAEPGLDPETASAGPDGVDAYVHVPPFIVVAARAAS